MHSDHLIAALVLVAAALGSMRAAGHKSQAFQAAAHLYVGGLLGALIVVRSNQGLWDWLLVALVAILSILEVICFLVFREKASHASP
jgi:hypothetical protein